MQLNPNKSGGFDESRRSKLAAIASSALVTLTMTGELQPALAETAANRNPLLVRADKRLAELVKRMRLLIKHHDPLSYQKPVSLSGKKMTEIVVSHPERSLKTGKKSFEQVVVYVPKGKRLPFSSGIITGAQSPEFIPGERFDSLTALTINPDRKDDYVIADYSFNAKGQLDAQSIEINGEKEAFWNGPIRKPEPINHDTVRLAFDGFTETILTLGSEGNKLPKGGFKA